MHCLVQVKDWRKQLCRSIVRPMRVQGDASVSLGAARLLCGRLRARVVPNRHVCKAVVLDASAVAVSVRDARLKR